MILFSIRGVLTIHGVLSCKLDPEKQLKIKVDFFYTLQPTRWLVVMAKMSTTDMCGLAAIQVWERDVIDTTLLWLPHRAYMVEILIGHEYCIGGLNKTIFKNIFSRSNRKF